MKMGEWLGSKKTKDMILTYAVLLGAGYLQLPLEVIAIIAAVGGVKITAQGVVDAKKKAEAKDGKD